MNGRSILDIVDAEKNGIRGRLTPNAPMSKITWFQVGGPADLLFQPADEADLACFLRLVPNDVTITVVGVGSNLLVRDGGIEGVVIRLSGKGFGGIELLPDHRMNVGAAVPDKRLASAALGAELEGFAFYHGIPGAVGGALRMNAGANGPETKDVVVEVRAMDRSGRIQTLNAADMGYSYRHSNADTDLIFLSAVFQGTPGDRPSIKMKMDEVQHHRETVQPIREKTGGSTFKNPLPHSSWKLIDDAGLRGFNIGDAQMSTMHCNFMINTGNATGYDLETLGETVRRRVHENSGVLLDWEIKRIGRFSVGREVDCYFPPI